MRVLSHGLLHLSTKVSPRLQLAHMMSQVLVNSAINILRTSMRTSVCSDTAMHTFVRSVGLASCMSFCKMCVPSKCCENMQNHSSEHTHYTSPVKVSRAIPQCTLHEHLIQCKLPYICALGTAGWICLASPVLYNLLDVRSVQTSRT